MDKQKPTIWIDADACPNVAKEVIYKACQRLQLPLILVANSYLTIPPSPLIRFIQVAQGADIADTYIAEHCSPKDLIITADIPLADLVVKKGALALNPRGDIYTPETISEKLATRNLMDELRQSGMDTGGPKSYSTKDKAAFANAFNTTLTKLLN